MSEHVVGIKCHRNHSQTLVRGPDANKFYRKNFFGPPFRPQKISGPPLFAMKMMGQPHRKACKLYFNLDICILFSRPPYKVMAPLFASDPLTSVCEWSLMAHNWQK